MSDRIEPLVPADPVRRRVWADLAPYTAAIAAWVMDGEGIFWPVIGVSEPEGGRPHRPSPDGECTVRPHLSSGNEISAPHA
jgi:hypothetical protein